LLLGPWRPVSSNEEAWEESLSSFAVDLLRDGEVVDRGHASNVLGGPLSALRHLVELLARDPVNPPLAAGEIVTTGTLTRVPPVAPGETWMTALSDLTLGDIAVRFT
jgi:2-oxo-3-hexenedioate decarboxylase